MDHHSSLAEDNFYLVNSLYMDTRGLEFLRQRLYGKDGRFNMRVRCYGDQGEAPYFLEVKRKSGVTLDTSMKYRVQDHYSLVPDKGMISYDNETIYARDMYTDAVVVLELKSEIGRVPTWMLDLISCFDLKQQGFSKYMSSFMVSYRDDGISYMNGDRMSPHYSFA